MVGHTFLYNPGIRKVREYVEKDEVGRLYYLYASRTNLGPFRHDVNALWDLATHDVSIFNYLLNATPLWVSAVGSNVLGNEHKDVGFVSISYPNNIIGHIHVSWAEPNKVRELVLVGSEKRVVFNDLDAVERVRVFEKGVEPTPEEADSFGEYQFLIRDGDIISPRVPVNEPLKAQCSHFLDCVTEQQQPFTDGRQGVEVVRVMEAIDRSIQNRGMPVEIYREKTIT
jgi:predicted dehydrogenase